MRAGSYGRGLGPPIEIWFHSREGDKNGHRIPTKNIQNVVCLKAVRVAWIQAAERSTFLMRLIEVKLMPALLQIIVRSVNFVLMQHSPDLPLAVTRAFVNFPDTKATKMKICCIHLL